MSWGVLGKVWLFAILPGYLSNDTWLHTAPTGHFSPRQEFGCKDVLQMLIFLRPSESYLGGREGFQRRAACVNFPSNTYSWSSEKDAENWTLYACISVKSEVSRAKAKHKRARLCGLELEQIHNLRAQGKEAGVPWLLARKLPSRLKAGVCCVMQSLKCSEVLESPWKTLSCRSVLCQGTECPGCPACHAGPAHGHGPRWAPRPCRSLGATESRVWGADRNAVSSSSVNSPLKTDSPLTICLYKYPARGNSSLFFTSNFLC